MAYAHFDTSPVTVEFDHDPSDFSSHKVQPVVYINDVEVWRGQWESRYGIDPDSLKYDWTQKWEAFQVESFKEWLRVKEEKEA